MLLIALVATALVLASSPARSKTISLASIKQIASSEDGSSFYFSTCDTDPCTVGIYDIANASLRLVPNTSGFSWFTPKPTRDGDAILVAAFTGKGSEIARVRPDGTGFTLITDLGLANLFPAPTADGASVVFARATKSTTHRNMPFVGYDIYAVGVDGGVTRKLTDYNLVNMQGPYPTDDGSIFFTTFAQDLVEYPNQDSITIDIIKKGYGLGDHTYRMGQDGQLEMLETMSAPEVSFIQPSRDGSEIFMTAVVNKMDGLHSNFVHDVFMRRHNTVLRLSTIRQHIVEFALAGDSKSGIVVTKNLDTGAFAILQCHFAERRCPVILAKGD